MRRTLIFILLGIICYSTITSILPSLPKQGSDKVLLDTVYGAVSAGNFNYWIYGHRGHLIIELSTITGDADLFVSDYPKPSYEADKHNFSSETCGTDYVFVPDDFPRPIGIAVYGQWSYEWSEFSLKVYLDVVKDSIYQGTSSTITPAANSQAATTMTASRSPDESPQAREAEMKRTEIFAKKEQEKPQFFKFFKILDTMFDLFVL